MCESCDKAMATAPWHSHARLMAERCVRWNAMQDARKSAVPQQPIVKRMWNEDPAWLTLAGLLLLAVMFYVAWVVTP